MSTVPVKGILRALLEAGEITPLSYYFSSFLQSSDNNQEDSMFALTAALVSERNLAGDVCVELGRFVGRQLFDSTLPVSRWPALAEWIAILRRQSQVGRPGDTAPLILDDDRLYLGKFWHFEQRVADAIKARLPPVGEINHTLLKQGLKRLFAESPDEIDWQKIAAAIAVTKRFAVISGGPGTGKTSTLVKVLALLLQNDPMMRIRLAAPTGKAAARMVESIDASKAALEIDEHIRGLIPAEASTIHRLLGYRGRSFTYHRDNQLAVECVVIDEASMVDLTLMYRLLEAIPDDARLILIGDRDQLAAVDAGSVLGDITGHGEEIRYTAAQMQSLESLTRQQLGRVIESQESSNHAVADCIALLQHSYRFRPDGGIGRLARLVNGGDAESAWRLIADSEDNGDDELAWIAASGAGLDPRVISWAVDKYTSVLDCPDPLAALETFAGTRILCALHHGPLGHVELNRLITESLRLRGLIDSRDDYQGRPVIVTVNDYELDLYNGDVGLMWRDSNGSLRAYFKSSAGDLRSFPSRSLPDHETAWAMTVHKSQGSEFDVAMLILPSDAQSPILTQELIYTAITRARSSITVHATADAFKKGCSRRVQRASGLAKKLGWPVRASVS